MAKKKGSTALSGLGVKFGAPVRKRYGKVHRTLHRKRRCPSCGSIRFRRLAAGIWHCPKCNCKALTPDIRLPPSSDARAEIFLKNSEVIFKIETNDIASMRATMNSYLRLADASYKCLSL